jgi:hypothetical protein
LQPAHNSSNTLDIHGAYHICDVRHATTLKVHTVTCSSPQQHKVSHFRINGLIVKTTSMSSSLSETSTSARDNARDKPSTQPRYAIKKPSMRLFPKTQAPLPTVNIMTKHSHTFNSSTATGLDKLGQLQFVEVLKNWIVGMWYHLYIGVQIR